MSAKREQKKVALGIDFGGTNTKLALVDNLGTILHEQVERSESQKGQEKCLARLGSLAREVCRKADADGYVVSAAGVAVCGPVDHDKGELIESPVLPGWCNAPFREQIQNTLGVPVCVDNDANAAILGEWWLGAGKRQPIVAGLTLGTGIGGGLVINGRTYRGAFGFAGEFGHIAVADSPDCPCGGRGCLGRVASATATLKRYNDIRGNTATPLTETSALAKRAEGGDVAAQNAILSSAEYLGKAVLSIVNCLNPNVFVLSGGMALIGSALLKPVQDCLNSNTFLHLGERTHVRLGELGVYSGCLGIVYEAVCPEN
jgi:glucokinase